MNVIHKQIEVKALDEQIGGGFITTGNKDRQRSWISLPSANTRGSIITP